MTVLVQIDGVSVPAIDGSSSRRLSRPSQATARVPIDEAVGGCGSLMKVTINGNLHHHGRVLVCEDSADENQGYTVYNSVDPMEMWAWRPARDPDGDFSKPDFFTDFVTGPQILESILTTSADGSDPAVGEGPLFLAMGTFEGGGADLSGAPVDWPMTIAEVASLLVSTGEVDIVITPIDSGGNIGEVSAYNGDYGTDLSGSISFDFATGDFNVRSIRRNQDMSESCNKLWYYLGPRVGTISDPEGDQHWRANITGDDPGLATTDATAYANVISQRSAHQAAVGVRMDIKIFDAQGDDDPFPARELYRRLWLIESWVRSQPRDLVHVSPTRETEIMTFDIGDLVAVSAGSVFRGGFSGAQRVFGYTISWDAETEWLEELQTSADADGMS